MNEASHANQELLESMLVEAIDGFSESLARGGRPNVEAYAAKYPEIADSLRRLLPALAVLDGTHSARQPEPAPVLQGTLGGFKILGEIGRGGMGIVYKAEEISLGRTVALKILPFTVTADEKQLNRFKNEARAAANLSHSNIVPVYSFGEHQGVHYYAMRLIEGRSLAELVSDLRSISRLGDSDCRSQERSLAVDLATRELVEREHDRSPVSPNQASMIQAPDVPGDQTMFPKARPVSRPLPLRPVRPGSAFFRNVARLGIQAAHALEYAHTHQILHRDIKPANLMVEPNGHLWVTDFGLARFESVARVTLSGDLLGTVRYMSPEQMTGTRICVDHRSDVYSLGITLYELLTRQPAFDGVDRFELLHQIAVIDPLHPRVIDPEIPGELSTIILKAIEKSADDRYSSAGELADDLQRFLDHQPIKAKPASVVLRATKWCRRHRAFVWACMVTMMLAIAILSVSVVLIARAYQAVAHQQKRAETNLRLARELIDETYSQELEAADNDLEMTPEQREILLRLVRFYEQLPREEWNDPTLRHDECKVRLRLGDIYRALGEFGKAVDAYSASIATVQQLGGDGARLAIYQQTLVKAYDGVGQAYREMQQFGSAIAAHQKAAELIQRLLAKHSHDPSVQRLTVNGIHLAQAYRDTATKEQCLRDVVEQMSALARQFSDEPLFESWLANARGQLGVLLRSTGRMREAETQFQQAIETQQRLVKLTGSHPSYRYHLAATQSELAPLLKSLRRDDEAAQANRAAIELLEPLAAEYPHRIRYRSMLAQCQSDLGYLLASSSQLEDSADALVNAISLLEELTREATEIPAHRSKLASCFGHLGNVEYRRGNYNASEELFAKSLSIWKSLADQFPDDPDYRMNLAVGLAESSRFADRKQRIVSLEHAAGVLHDLNRRFPERTEYMQLLIRATRQLGLELTAEQRLDEAEQQFLKAIAVADEFTRAFPEILRDEESAHEYALFGDLSRQLGKFEQAVNAHRTATENYRTLMEQYPAKPEYRSQLCSNLKRLGYALTRLGQFGEARRCYDESIGLAEQLIAAHPGVAEYRAKLVRRYELLAALNLRLAAYDQAEQTFRKQLEAISDHARLSNQRVSQLSPAQIHTLLANILLKQNPPRPSDAASEMRLAIDLCNQAGDLLTSTMLQCQLADILTQHDQCDDARRLLAELLAQLESRETEHFEDVTPGNLPALVRWQIARGLNDSGDAASARQIVNELLDKPIDSLLHKYTTVRSLSEWQDARPEHVRMAIQLGRELVESAPREARYWFALGAAQYRAHEYASSIDSLQRSLSLQPIGELGVQLYLAMARFQAGDHEPARKHLEQANRILMFQNPFRIAEYRRLQDEAAQLMGTPNQVAAQPGHSSDETDCSDP
jgi:serine/threonine protein kinase